MEKNKKNDPAWRCSKCGRVHRLVASGNYLPPCICDRDRAKMIPLNESAIKRDDRAHV